MKQEIRFGIIGCGRIYPWHQWAVMNTKGTKLVAVCDIVEERAKQAAAQSQCDYYTDYIKLLQRDDIDAVCLCTPSYLHSIMAIDCAKAGKHVLTEKPIAIKLDDADKMITACKKANVKLGCIFQRRVDETFIKVRKALDNNELGKLVLGDIYMKYYRNQQYYDNDGWRGKWNYDGGGVLMNQGVHIIDILQWFMGPVDEIASFTGTLLRNIECEDTAVASIRFKNGALGVIEGATSVYPSTIEHRIEIHGEKGSIMFQGDRIIRWDVIGSDGKPVSKIESENKKNLPPVSTPDYSSMEGHRRLIEDFADAIRTGKEPVVTGEEARKSLELTLAVYESAKKRKIIKL